jgi:hypothetical protein
VNNKPSGLAAFSRKGVVAAPQVDEPTVEKVGAVRGRGKKEVVALTVRLPRAQWERLHQLAAAEGTSIQALAVQGLSRVFTERGLPGLDA